MAYGLKSSKAFSIFYVSGLCRLLLSRFFALSSLKNISINLDLKCWTLNQNCSELCCNFANSGSEPTSGEISANGPT